MGYVEPDTTIDAMFDQAVSAEWERQNTPQIDPELLRKASAKLVVSILHMDTAAEYIKNAMDILTDTVAEDRIGAMLNDVENILCDLRAMKTKYGRGEM